MDTKAISPHLFEGGNVCRFCKCRIEEVEDNLISLECVAFDFIELTLYEKYKQLCEKSFFIKSEITRQEAILFNNKRDWAIIEAQIKTISNKLGYATT